ncbi:high frequency lysogenization protein HflD [Pseudomonas matsuisoli]|uniref:High frequency lysogenization protein HflD homolog n=1 Tax=Pseudomonas matsuisoli TaxID=1515666 RepID=A0A917PLV0_9PSED|nr:high frequency lysogenization protein HflD [Pseudomonas matsuisoli]GGJ84338.1 high frequency lysogenization protein HflD [Pseudomonas matsuisoli]
MNRTQEQLVALGGVFQAAVLVDLVARTGQVNERALSCMISSLLIRDPGATLDVYGGDDTELQEGYKALAGALEREPGGVQREPLRYALSLVGLERQLSKRGDMLDTIGNRLGQIQSQAEHFGITHENVLASCGGLYEDTISTFRQRIQVQGDMRFLQQSANAAKIRALLLSGIRSALLWRQLGGHRWQLVFSRRKLLKELYPRMRR